MIIHAPSYFLRSIGSNCTKLICFYPCLLFCYLFYKWSNNLHSWLGLHIKKIEFSTKKVKYRLWMMRSVPKTSNMNFIKRSIEVWFLLFNFFARIQFKKYYLIEVEWYVHSTFNFVVNVVPLVQLDSFLHTCILCVRRFSWK